MIRHKNIIIATALALPICLYVNAGAINKFIDVGMEFVQYGYKVFSNKNVFNADINHGFTKSKNQWSSGITNLKKHSIETIVHATNNEITSAGKAKTKTVLQYTFGKEEVKKIVSITSSEAIDPIAVIDSIATDKKLTIPNRKSNIKTTFPVTIKTIPSNARVRIMNIAAPYQDGIKLKKGRYDIEVTLDSYRSQRFWTDFDPIFNQLEVNLNKKGSLSCKGVEISEAGSMWQEYGSQVKIVDYFENVTVSEIYFSQLDFISSRNYIEFYHNDISGDFAYFNYIYGFLNKNELNKNKKIEAKKDRYNNVHIGIENVPGENRVKMITFVETPQYALAHSIREAYCKSLETL